MIRRWFTGFVRKSIRKMGNQPLVHRSRNCLVHLRAHNGVCKQEAETRPEGPKNQIAIVSQFKKGRGFELPKLSHRQSTQVRC